MFVIFVKYKLPWRHFGHFAYILSTHPGVLSVLSPAGDVSSALSKLPSLSPYTVSVTGSPVSGGMTYTVTLSGDGGKQYLFINTFLSVHKLKLIFSRSHLNTAMNMEVCIYASFTIL